MPLKTFITIAAIAVLIPAQALAAPEDLKVCFDKVRNDPAHSAYYRKRGTGIQHLSDQSRATPEEIRAMKFARDGIAACEATAIAELRAKRDASAESIADLVDARRIAVNLSAARLARREISWGVYNEQVMKIAEDVKAKFNALSERQRQEQERNNDEFVRMVMCAKGGCMLQAPR